MNGDAEKPRRGDRVHLAGNHRKAGYEATYIDDRRSEFGVRPWVLLDDGTECFVMEPDTQMQLLRKGEAMAVAIHVYITGENGNFSGVEHVFYGATEEEANKVRLQHLAGCENYGKAEVADRAWETVEDELDPDDIPTPEMYEEPEADDDEAEDEEEEADEK